MTRKSEREILDDIGSYDITHLTISSEGLPSTCRIANNLSHLTLISVDSTTPLLRYTGALIYICTLGDYMGRYIVEKTSN